MSIQKILVALFLVVECIHFSFAQSTDSSTNKFVWKVFWTNNFNPGISAGVGGGRLFYFLPTFRLKFGPVTGYFERIKYGDYDKQAFQFDLDLFRINKSSTQFRDDFTIGVGMINYHRYTYPVESDHFFIHGGINRYLFNKHWSYSAKIGYKTKIKTINKHPDNQYQYYEMPYGEISVAYNLFAFKEKNDIHINPDAVEREIKNWFNPYLSFGVGFDRILVMPAWGVKIGPLNAQMSGFATDASGVYLINAMFDLFKLKENQKYCHHFTAGFNYINSFGGDGLSHTDKIYQGAMIGRKSYRIGSFWDFEVKTGICQYVKTDGGIDLDTNESYEFQTKSYLPMIAAGFTFHLFKISQTRFSTLFK
ncbi:MAG: hypothetical protein GC181_09085 [Bacteroidetes bacterium]|nr:hypothetical protein [Bacteroidota bacterium]